MFYHRERDKVNSLALLYHDVCSEKRERKNKCWMKPTFSKMFHIRIFVVFSLEFCP